MNILITSCQNGISILKNKKMEKAYHIEGIKFDNEYLSLMIDNHLVEIKLADISEKLAKATTQEQNDYQISPSGYGISWRLLDEDLSINGLLKAAKIKPAFQH